MVQLLDERYAGGVLRLRRDQDAIRMQIAYVSASKLAILFYLTITMASGGKDCVLECCSDYSLIYWMNCLLAIYSSDILQ